MSRTPSRPVVVELLGLPGAGKSTLGDAPSKIANVIAALQAGILAPTEMILRLA